MREKIMNAKVAVPTALLATSTVVASSFWVADADSTSRERHIERFTVVERINPKTNIDIDLGQPGFSVGDQQVFKDGVYKAAKRVGTVVGEGEIVALSHSALTAQGVGTLFLPRGRLTLQIAVRERLADGPPKVSHATITGGTRHYAEARGECTSTRINDRDSRVTCSIVVGDVG
jgi:hypothetical protein